MFFLVCNTHVYTLFYCVSVVCYVVRFQLVSIKQLSVNMGAVKTLLLVLSGGKCNLNQTLCFFSLYVFVAVLLISLCVLRNLVSHGIGVGKIGKLTESGAI